MGNSHSPQDCGRSHSLVPEEFLFPESRLESDRGWEVFHVHIELKPLPAHVRDSIHVCVDDYTQEILSWAEECVCACACRSSSAGRTWCSDSQMMIQESECEGPQRERDDASFCLQWDANTDLLCALNAHHHTETRRPGLTHRLSSPSSEGLDVNLCGENQAQDSISSDDPRDEDVAEAILPHEVLVTGPVLHSRKEARREMSEPRDIPQDRCKTAERNSSRRIEPRCMTEGEAASPCFRRKGKMSANELRSRTNALTSETSTDQEQVLRSTSQTFPRRQSCSIPIVRDKVTAPLFTTPQNSPKRKFSLKDDPGWIPNPLDSDSDSSDLEDSGIFSDCAGSPRTSALPAHYIPAITRADVKERVLSRERRRYNSEPMQRTSPLSSSPLQRGAEPTPGTSPESASETKAAEAAAAAAPRRRSRWRLLSLSRKTSQPHKADAGGDSSAAQAEDSPQDEEDDLSEQLKWLAMSDCQISQDADSSPQPEDHNTDFSFPQPSPTNAHSSRNDDDPEAENTRENSTDPSSSPQEEGEAEEAAAASRRRSSNFDGDLELDWLCEPEWNNLELELFWSVLRPHLEHLLQPEDSELLPEACRAVGRLDAADPKMLDRCLLHVQWHIWKGSYCQAVADFRAIRRHFLCCAQSQLIETGTRDDVENLRLIFQRKRPSRFRLWI